jgi:hypothetical protein
VGLQARPIPEQPEVDPTGCDRWASDCPERRLQDMTEHVLAVAFYTVGVMYYSTKLWLLVKRSKDRE